MGKEQVWEYELDADGEYVLVHRKPAGTAIGLAFVTRDDGSSSMITHGPYDEMMGWAANHNARSPAKNQVTVLKVEGEDPANLSKSLNDAAEFAALVAKHG